MATTLRLPDYLGPGDYFHIARTERSAIPAMQPHGHAFAEIFWVTGQNCRHELNGIVHEMLPGELAVIHTGDVHTLNPTRTGAWSVYNIAFPADDLRRIAARHPAAAQLFAPMQPGGASPRYGASQVDYLLQIFDRLLMLPRDRLALEWWLLGLSIELMPRLQIEVPIEAPGWLREVCHRIARPEHFALGPIEMARLAGRTPEHLARSVRRWLGCSPGDLITRLRLHYARHQLQSTNTPIKSIVQNCGLRNLSHFYRLFEAEFGLPPAAWRRRHGASPPM